MPVFSYLSRTMLLVLVLCSTVLPLRAQQAIVDQFQSGSLLYDGITYPYRLFVPADYDSTRLYPLVLTLHGAGERGTDNERHIRPHRLATAWADPANQAEYPAFVLAPQVPPGSRWTSDRPVDESAFIPVQRATLAILDAVEATYSIDPDRLYITGLSLGGHATWDFIARLPHRFAAAVPMSGNADPTQAETLRHMPIWSFHGESDTVVRPNSSRALIQNMEDLRRAVVYTDCRRAPPQEVNFNCPSTLPNSTLAAAIDAHADLILTSVRAGGHGPWSVWYDHPLLFDWVFSKHRVDPEALGVIAPTRGATWSGTQTIMWTSPQVTPDTVEVWLSVDNQSSWQKVDEVALGDGQYVLDTSLYPDAALAHLRLAVRNAEGFIYGQAMSAAFHIDNAGDAPPLLLLNDDALRLDNRVTSEALDLSIRAIDPEGSTLRADVFFSIDGGQTFGLLESLTVPSSLDPQPIRVRVADVSNSAEAQVRIMLSDGTHSVEATTVSFIKETPRVVNDFVQHVQGEGEGTVTMHFIDPTSLTNHRYQVTIDDTNPVAKTYSVTDMTRGTQVLTDIPLSDGISESPLFDGMRLIVQDLEQGMPNLDKTGWLSGNSTLGVSISGGTAILALRETQLLATENEYELTIADAVVDTSEALFAFSAQEMQFTITSRSDGQRRKVLYRDNIRDGRPWSRDLLYILEEDANGELQPAWEFLFNATSTTARPEPGDTFLFVPRKRLSANDIFEFEATIGVRMEEVPATATLASLSTYPNPFSDEVTVTYRLAESATVVLEVYDLLGRRVALLGEQAVTAGSHRATWTAPHANGMYVLQMTVTPSNSATPKTWHKLMARAN